MGDQLGGYRLVEVLGVGGMGTVYLANDSGGGDRVALKVLSPDIATNEAFRRRFLREADYARSVEHPNIVRVRDAGESDGLLFIAMDYVDGADLATILRRDGRLDPTRATGILMQVAEALDTIHAAGLIHRDVKPANCLVTGSPPQEHALLTDFGVSRNPLKDSAALTVAGDFVGTHFYTAPEQLFGDPDPRADVYSLGCVLYECLTGRPPFPFDDVAAVLEAHVDMPPPALTELRPDLPPELGSVISRALSKLPGDRFDTCAGLIAAARATLVGGAPTPSTTLTLAIAEGSAVGGEIEVTEEVVIGRAEEGAGALGGDIELSRRHARIFCGVGGFFVEDLGSTNGTLRNRRPVEGPELLQDGDELELGSTRLTVRARPAPPAPPEPTVRPALRLVLERDGGEIALRIDGGRPAARLEVDGGRWRLRSE